MIVALVIVLWWVLAITCRLLLAGPALGCSRDARATRSPAGSHSPGCACTWCRPPSPFDRASATARASAVTPREAARALRAIGNGGRQ